MLFRKGLVKCEMCGIVYNPLKKHECGANKYGVIITTAQGESWQAACKNYYLHMREVVPIVGLEPKIYQSCITYTDRDGKEQPCYLLVAQKDGAIPNRAATYLQQNRENGVLKGTAILCAMQDGRFCALPGQAAANIFKVWCR